MAKQKQELSMAELLEQALVPEAEQPYKVPENWVWTRLGNITSVIGGGTPSSRVNEYYENGSIPWISPVDLSGYTNIYISHGKKNITELGLKKSSARIMPSGTVLLSSRAPIGYVAIAENVLSTNQGFKNFLPSVAYLPKYLYFYLKYSKLLLESYASGTTFLELSASKVSLVEIPLSPLVEQQRIVDCIESLFAKLDKAKELVQNALDSFANRKAAILHQAFSGELTANWRREHGIGIDSWEEKPLAEMCDSFQYGTSKKSEKNGNIVVIRMGNLQDGEIDWNNLAYTTSEEDIAKYLLKSGDVLFNRTNSPVLVGKTSIYRGEHPAIFAGYLIRINYKNCLIGEYLNYALNTQKSREYYNQVKSDGVNQSNINAKKLSKLIIPVCSVQEQQEIVRILVDLLGADQKAHAMINNIAKFDLMKKSILAQAFRGALDTNNPSEENAKKLLKKVLQEKL